MKRIWCGRVLHDERARPVPWPKNRTPFISAPSVTPVATNVIASPDARSDAE